MIYGPFPIPEQNQRSGFQQKAALFSFLGFAALYRDAATIAKTDSSITGR